MNPRIRGLLPLDRAGLEVVDIYGRPIAERVDIFMANRTLDHRVAVRDQFRRASEIRACKPVRSKTLLLPFPKLYNIPRRRAQWQPPDGFKKC